MNNNINIDYKKLEECLIKIRREIHMNPELSLQEFETSELIVKTLKSFGIDNIKNNIYKTTVIATIEGKYEGKTVLIRADMDALPITEETNFNFKSRNSGIMHACGHDAHITWLLGIAYLLNLNKDNLKGKFKLLFQPAEEGDGGADSLLNEYNLLEEDGMVDYAIAAHVWPEINSGEYGLVNGCAMASANKLELTILGKGGHGAEPHKTIDPIALASTVYVTSQQILSRRANPFSSSVLTFGVIEGRGAFNVIPDSVYMEGTVRAESYEEVSRITRELEKITEGIVTAQGGSYELKVSKPILPVINDKFLVEKSVDVFESLGYKLRVLDHGAMTGEDFCYFSSKVPSLFFYVGTKNEAKECIYPLHNSRFKIDENILINTAKTIYEAICEFQDIEF
ncbi:MAG: M20 metallopeptidase family protein [Clostridium sp.]